MPASVWIRCLQLIPYLKKHGVVSTVNNPNTDEDVAIFVRWQDKQAYKLAKNKKKKGQRIIFDLCVNYFDETGLFHGEYGSTKERVMEAARMVELADIITCASEFIKQRASEYHPNVIYLPDSVNFNHFRFKKSHSDFDKRVLTAVWAGQSNKIAELVCLYPLLSRRRIPLVIISDKKPSLPGPYIYMPWSYHAFPRNILRGDLCIAPRSTDNPYDLGHSHFKIGVFMAEGVPALASPLPSYVEVIGETGAGKICDSEESWESTIDRVLEDRQMLKIWSLAAQRRMYLYSTESIAQRYIQLFRDAK
jgi:nuclear transport factor 2 (NTF2) superfamily protein